ncbi:small GTP-binding domain protein (macronuclear) [Tetrahymena thermophila SB210]|uniref:Small GTP-binding domain protein n=1 Tax=Tetrahymena thermophila (strain SB210) TaxID=312017 RepID=W7XF50_TETTS|nr:small GTP-binding domain protein [Tetrahymena thermophila SB210]EWS71394.1 small GTP-binding domain protein [Tetrahymena thermophila SB210]|eukprot:XP_012656066.1 small GTP-binding domain protein [Tetrahymena thermophila SB210]
MFDQLDIFASQIFLRFNKQATYKTRLGSYVSLIIIFLIIYKLVGTMVDLIQKNNPQVIYNDRQVDNPAAFIANSKTFPIAFGMERPIDFTHFIDESIYTVSAFWKHKIQIYDETAKQYVAVWDQKSVDIKPCTLDNFQNPDNQKYYLSLNYTDMYCLPPDLDLTIQGDFPSPEYSEIELIVKKCTQNCQPQEILDQFLLKSNFGIQMSDSYVDPSIPDNPFKIYSRDMFWSTSTQLPKDVFVYIRNNYVYSDFGLLFSDVKTQVFPSYSFYQTYEFPPSFQDYFLSIHFRFETQKEGVYKRSYQKFSQMISEIGGYIQSFLAIGYLICRKASQVKLDIDLISRAFKFQESTQNEEQQQIQKEKKEQIEKAELIDRKKIKISQKKQLNDKKHKKKEKEKTFNTEEYQQKQDEQNSNFFQSANLYNHSQKINNYQQAFKNSQIIDNNGQIQHSNEICYNLNKQDVVLQQKESKQKNSLNISNLIMSYFQDQAGLKEVEIVNSNEDFKFQKQKRQSFSQKIKKQKCVEETFQNYFDSQMNNFRISAWEYLKSQLFCYFSKFYNNRKKIINYTKEKLYNYIDLFNIINKLNEIEKLKRLILDEDQLKLFDYLPKPTISADIISKSHFEQKRKEVDLLYQDQRSELQKASDSFQAYYNLVQKCELTTLDQKLIHQIDPDLKKIFQDISKKQDFQTNQFNSEDNKQTEVSPQIRQSIYFNNQNSVNRIQKEKNTFKIELISEQGTPASSNNRRNSILNQFRKFDEIKEPIKSEDILTQLFTTRSQGNQNEESHLNEFQYKNDQQKPNAFRSRLNQLSQL